MYTVSYFSKLMFHFLLTVVAALLFAVSHSKYVFVLYTVTAIWLQLYLMGMNIVCEKGKLIKHSGNIFKRKTVFMLKTLNIVTTYIFLPAFPALLRLSYPDREVYLLGLSGRQVKSLADFVQNN